MTQPEVIALFYVCSLCFSAGSVNIGNVLNLKESAYIALQCER